MNSRTGKTGPESAQEPNQAGSKPLKAKGAGLAVFLSLLSLAGAGAAIGGGYYFFTKEYLPLKSNLQAAHTETQQQMSAQSESVSNQLQQQIQTVEQINQSVVARQESLQSTFDDIIEDLGILKYKANWGQREWTLAEVGYLLRMANDRLNFMRDINTTKATVRTAIRRVDHLADPSLAALKQQMVADLQSLNMYIPPDATSVLSKLDAMIAALKPFPIGADEVDAGQDTSKDSGEATVESDEETLVQEERPRWLEFVETARSELQNRVRVVRHDQRLNALDQSTVQQYQLEMAKLRLEAMRMALQREDAAAFQRELLALDGWAQSSLTQKNAVPLRAELQRLGSEPLFQPLPSLSGSMNALAGLLKDPSMEAPEAPSVVEEPTGAQPELPGAPEVDATEAPVESAEEPSSEPAQQEAPVAEIQLPAPPIEVTEEPSKDTSTQTAEGRDETPTPIKAPAPVETADPVQMPEVVPKGPELLPPPSPLAPDTGSAQEDVSMPSLERQAVPLPEAVVPDAAGKPEVM